MIIRKLEEKDLPEVIAVWNEAVQNGEVVYYPLTVDYFMKKFVADPNYDPALSFVAEENGEVVGFINGVAKKIFLNGESAENTPGYLTCIFVKKAYRNTGIGKKLVNTLENAFRAMGKHTISCEGGNPINLDWIVPGTPGHDHNNAPGVDTECQGYGFLKAIGYRDAVRDIAMYLNLADYIPWVELEARKKALADEGIYVGRYDTTLNYDFDGMCDRVGSEYWRDVLRSEINCHRLGIPNTDLRFIPNGKIPAGPRPILVATCGHYIIAQTGPVDRQESGRGWFTGICTDPLYERRGIASVLFNVLMQEFIAEGAVFSTLFTGESNHAQKIYKRAGFRIVRRFAVMRKEL